MLLHTASNLQQDYSEQQTSFDKPVEKPNNTQFDAIVEALYAQFKDLHSGEPTAKTLKSIIEQGDHIVAKYGAAGNVINADSFRLQYWYWYEQNAAPDLVGDDYFHMPRYQFNPLNVVSPPVPKRDFDLHKATNLKNCARLGLYHALLAREKIKNFPNEQTMINDSGVTKRLNEGQSLESYLEELIAAFSARLNSEVVDTIERIVTNKINLIKNPPKENAPPIGYSIVGSKRKINAAPAPNRDASVTSALATLKVSRT